MSETRVEALIAIYRAWMECADACYRLSIKAHKDGDSEECVAREVEAATLEKCAKELYAAALTGSPRSGQEDR